ESVVAAGGKDTAIPSGPLHDAAEMARLLPTVMIFSKSSPPVSHTPEEDTPEADLRVAIEAYGRTVARALEVVAAGDLGGRDAVGASRAEHGDGGAQRGSLASAR